MLSRTCRTEVPVIGEMLYAIHFSILGFLKTILNERESMAGILLVLYHFLWLRLDHLFVDEYVLITEYVIACIQRDFEAVLMLEQPGVEKFISRFLVHSKHSSCGTQFFLALFRAETKRFKSSERSVAWCVRELANMKLDTLRAIAIDTSEKVLGRLGQVIEKLISIAKDASDGRLNIEEKLLIMTRQILVLKPSPDALVGQLQKLAYFHEQNDYFEEELQTRWLIIAVIAEYLTLQHRIPQFWGTLHPGNVFSGLCSASKDIAVCRSDQVPLCPGYCDSELFNFASLLGMIEQIPEDCHKKGRCLEQVIHMIDIVGPVYAMCRTWKMGQSFFEQAHQAFDMLSEVPADQDPMYGHYFQVVFHGKLFGETTKAHLSFAKRV